MWFPHTTQDGCRSPSIRLLVAEQDIEAKLKNPNPLEELRNQAGKLGLLQSQRGVSDQKRLQNSFQLQMASFKFIFANKWGGCSYKWESITDWITAQRFFQTALTTLLDMKHAIMEGTTPHPDKVVHINSTKTTLIPNLFIFLKKN